MDFEGHAMQTFEHDRTFFSNIYVNSIVPKQTNPDSPKTEMNNISEKST